MFNRESGCRNIHNFGLCLVNTYGDEHYGKSYRGPFDHSVLLD